MKHSIIIERINNFEYSFGKTQKQDLRHVAKALTFLDPDPNAMIRKKEMFDKRLRTFRIGLLKYLIEYLERNKIRYEISDFENSLPVGINIDSRMSGNYVHQQRAVESFFEKRFGIIVVPTRGGKTFVASEISRIFVNSDSGNFLFIVDTDLLFNQAVGEDKVGILDASVEDCFPTLENWITKWFRK